MRVGLPQIAFQAASPALEPGAKGGEADLLALGDGDRIDELAKTHEFGVLARIFVAVRAVEPARRLRQIGRERHIKNVSGRLAHLGERHGRLARARGADDDERRRMAAHRLLGGVENDRLVDEIEFHGLRRQPLELPAQARARLGLRRQIVRAGLDLVAIHRRAPQEAGLFVGVVGDHLQKQADGFAVVRGKLHQEARLVAELGAPIGRGGEFLEPGGGEVAAGERRAQSFERFGEAAGAEVAVCDNSHSASVRERRAETASFSRATISRMTPFVDGTSRGTPRMKSLLRSVAVGILPGHRPHALPELGPLPARGVAIGELNAHRHWRRLARQPRTPSDLSVVKEHCVAPAVLKVGNFILLMGHRGFLGVLGGWRNW